MLNFIIDNFIIGFVIFYVFKVKLYPWMARYVESSPKKLATWIRRKVYIWQHYSEGHNGQVYACQDRQCSIL